MEELGVVGVDSEPMAKSGASLVGRQPPPPVTQEQRAKGGRNAAIVRREQSARIEAFARAVGAGQARKLALEIMEKALAGDFRYASLAARYLWRPAATSTLPDAEGQTVPGRLPTAAEARAMRAYLDALASADTVSATVVVEDAGGSSASVEADFTPNPLPTDTL